MIQINSTINWLLAVELLLNTRELSNHRIWCCLIYLLISGREKSGLTQLYDCPGQGTLYSGNGWGENGSWRKIWGSEINWEKSIRQIWSHFRTVFSFVFDWFVCALLSFCPHEFPGKPRKWKLYVWSHLIYYTTWLVFVLVV